MVDLYGLDVDEEDLKHFRDRLRDEPSFFVKKFLEAEPTDYQAEFMNHPSDRKVFRAGRQVGKSRVAAWMALHFALTKPNVEFPGEQTTCLILASSLRQASELFNQVKNEINNSSIPGDAWGIDRETQTLIEFDNNSRIACIPTGRNGSKIRGFTADLIIVDEAAFIENMIFEEILEPMLWVNNGTLVLCSTPYGMDGYFYEKATKPEFPKSRWYTKKVTSYDNPHIDDWEIDDYKEGKDYISVQQEVYGEFVPASNAFFPPPLVKACMPGDTGEDDDRVLRETEDVYLGCDLAAHGADDTVFVLCDGNGNVFKIENYQGVGLTESVERIKALDATYNFKKIVVDRGGLGEMPVETVKAAFGRRAEGVFLSLQKKQSIFQSGKADMESGIVRIIDDRDMRDQLKNMGYSKTKNGNLSIHAKGTGKDDYVDALMLALWAAEPGGRKRRRKGSREAFDMGSL